MAGIGHVSTEHMDLAGLDLLRAREDGQQRRLADTVGTDQRDETSLPQIERHVFQSDAPADSDAKDPRPTRQASCGRPHRVMAGLVAIIHVFPAYT